MKLSLLCVALLATSAMAMYANTDVLELTPANFDKEVLQHKGVVLVEFYAPWCGHCKNLAPEWVKAAKALQGIVKVVAVNADQHQALGSRYGVTGFPTLKVFGDDKSKPEDLNARSAKDIVSEALRISVVVANGRLGLKSGSGSSGSGGKKDSGAPSQVVDLTEEDFETKVLQSNELWLVEFYAPWCGHCKNLAPEWKAAAGDLVGSVKLGAVDATVHKALASKYNIRGFPTIYFFGPDKSRHEEYDGGRTQSAIVAWAMKKYDMYGPPVVIPEINSNDAFQKECLQKKKICVAVALPPIFDTTAEERTKMIDLLADVSKKLRSVSLSIVWFSGGSQPKFEEMFRLSMNYPTFVAISPSKMRYAVHKGAFTPNNILEELKRIAEGRSSTSEMKVNPPEFVKTEPWDGKDYVPSTDE
eukprot:PhF_6_TR40932/c0_g1_i1/m.61922/K09584/PDIA6, TXNDC7; protein disulfide-isomerase A6